MWLVGKALKRTIWDLSLDVLSISMAVQAGHGQMA